MTSLDLMRAAVPVFQPVSSGIKLVMPIGEHKMRIGTFFWLETNFFDLFDTDSDGLISFPSIYFYYITFAVRERGEVHIPKVDRDGSENFCIEFAMMKYRRSTSRAMVLGKERALNQQIQM